MRRLFGERRLFRERRLFEVRRLFGERRLFKTSASQSITFRNEVSHVLEMHKTLLLNQYSNKGIT